MHVAFLRCRALRKTGHVSGIVGALFLLRFVSAGQSATLYTWQQLVPGKNNSTPLPRRDHTAILRGNQVVVFGGRAESASSGSTVQYLNDLWQYNISSRNWTLLRPQRNDNVLPSGRPAARYGHSAVFLSIRGVDAMIVYGGYSPLCVDYCGDIWQYTFVTDEWRQYNRCDFEILRAGSPPYDRCKGPWIGKRWAHATVSDGNSTMWVIGGFRSWLDTDEDQSDRGFLNDLWKVDFDRMRMERQLPATDGSIQLSLLRRLGAAVAWDAPRRCIWLFGGYWSNETDSTKGNWYDDLWRYDVDYDTWSLEPIHNPKTTIRPPGRYAASLYVYNNLLVLYGGRSGTSLAFGELWHYSTEFHGWAQYNETMSGSILSLPTPRARQALIPLSEGHAIIFGGASTASTLSEMWLYTVDACRNNCSLHGTCYYGYCICNNGYYNNDYYRDCSAMSCPDAVCSFDHSTYTQTCIQCSGPTRGVCNGKGNCSCISPATGPTCNLNFCPNNCQVRNSVQKLNGDGPVLFFNFNYTLDSSGRIADWPTNPKYAGYQYYAQGKCMDNGTCLCEELHQGPDCSLLVGCSDPRASNFDSTQQVDITDFSLCVYPLGQTSKTLPDVPVVYVKLSVAYNDFVVSGNLSSVIEGLAEFLQTYSDNNAEPFPDFDPKRLVVLSITSGSTLVKFAIVDSEVSKASDSTGVTPGSALDVAAFLKVQLITDDGKNALANLIGIPVDPDKPFSVQMPDTDAAKKALLSKEIQQLGSTDTQSASSGQSFLWVFAFIWAAVLFVR